MRPNPLEGKQPRERPGAVPALACGAKLRGERAGRTCQQPAMPNGRCRQHGGASLRGPAAPSFRTGEHSRYQEWLPPNLRESYEASLADPALIELRAEVALVDSRLSQLLTRLDTAETGQMWRELADAWRDLKAAKSERGGALDETAILLSIETLIERGLGDVAAWKEIGEWVEQRRKLVGQEVIRLRELQQTLTQQQALGLISVLAQSLRRHVLDPDVRQRIVEDLRPLLEGARREVIASPPALPG